MFVQDVHLLAWTRRSLPTGEVFPERCNFYVEAYSKTGVIHSGDLFYGPDESATEAMERMGVLAVEMEAAGLYGLAAEHGGRALAIVTVSDIIGKEEAMSSEERERSLAEMIEIALDALHRDRG